MASNIERRANTWYATLHVPGDVQHAIGKAKFFQSLKTTDKRVAESRAKPIVAQWKAQIAAARGVSDPFIEEALMWKRTLEQAEWGEGPDEPGERDTLGLVLTDHLDRLIEKGKLDYGQAYRLHAIATKQDTLLSEFFTEWAAQLTQAPKTVDQMKQDVQRMIDRFGTVQSVTKSAVNVWIKELIEGTPSRPGYSYASLNRKLQFCRNYWRYLQETEKADPNLQPFVMPPFAKKNNGRKGKINDSWIPFQPSEVVRLLEEAAKKNDHILADLIRLAMYTGARLEELCALKTADCTEEALKITESKTEAGVRRVPVHSALVEVVKRLREASTDGYLLSGLTFNKYNDRSNAIGKRFGRLKKTLGFPDKKVFHSIRKTVVTMLEDAGVSENLTADIVGHEKPRITYGLYSGGHSLERMKEAIEKVSYPEPAD
ncbi:tyrosine-type recombinase/integrase [Thiococcus pfennigii]|uniref:tyrosine-type recombinase/integrase n=1 Tax=Thiococcus pfennigii TaxID=1057 RepID=UPI0019081BCA|nr:DUF6538 domain-containing protein [Thiococcus pfennigii]MBK1702530.1 hypothetical protein [Thiococcus pfennigii]